MKTLIIWIVILGHMTLCGYMLAHFGTIATFAFFILTFVVGSFILDGLGVPSVPTAPDALSRQIKKEKRGE